MLHIEHLLQRKPAQLSGGEQQRVALGRALVREPRAFLMDEPLTNLDLKLRVEMRTELTRIHRSLGRTFLYVTNDQVEAMSMADQVAVLHAGAVQQVGAPTEIYNRPANRWVGTFVGWPRMNLLPCTANGRLSGNGWQLPNPGFAVDNILIADLPVSPAAYKDPVERMNFFSAVLERAAAIPGVRSAGATLFSTLASILR